MARNRVIWWDLETGGLNPFHNPIIEIAALDNFGNGFQSLLKINKPLDPKIVAITKITDSMLETEGRDYNQVVMDFHHFMTGSFLSAGDPYKRNQRTFMIAHNGDSFDRMFIKTAFKSIHQTIPNNIFFLDSLHLARMVLPNRNTFKQEHLAEKYHISNPNAHRAMGDVIVLKEVWQNLVQEYEKIHGKNDIISIYNSIYF